MENVAVALHALEFLLDNGKQVLETKKIAQYCELWPFEVAVK